MKKIKYLAFLSIFITSSTFAQAVKVAVATNLQSVIKVLKADFKSKTGIDIEPIIGSSGNLATQIRNGAPYDVFLSADMTFPKNLFKEGLSLKKPVVYAQGSLIICSSQDIGFENWERTLMTSRINKIAIANPAIAPYGKAAQEVLKKRGILDDVENKLVTGESISQVNTYITTGNVDLGFTTQALVEDPSIKHKLYWKTIEPQLYSPIEQGMILIKRTGANANAAKFYNYILGPAAKAIFKKYGYIVKE